MVIMQITFFLTIAIVIALLPSTSDIGSGNLWRCMTIGLGISVDKSDNVAAATILNACMKTDNIDFEKAGIGLTCGSHLFLLLCEVIAYGCTARSIIGEINSALDRRPQRIQLRI